MRRVLLIAFHFPPFAGSSGVQRAFQFARYLPEFGWEPCVLTAHPHAYETRSNDLLSALPKDLVIERAFAPDAVRYFSLYGKYPALFARPDRWHLWRLDGIRRAMKLVDKYKPHAIWSTYPIPTAHVIGAAVHDRSGLPWVADFRDPMAQEGYPADPKTWQSFRRIEERAVRTAQRVVFVTRGAARMYKERYSDLPADRWAVIENGYDEEAFTALESTPAMVAQTSKLTLLHSGVIYPSERDPTHLFAALGRLKQSGEISEQSFCVRFRASCAEGLLERLTVKNQLEGIVEIAPPISHSDALAEFLKVDALLLLQASNCNAQIPAKYYEYLRSLRPIVGLTDPAGDTAEALRRARIDYVAPLDSRDEICRVFRQLIHEHRAGTLRGPDHQAVHGASRRARTAELAEQFESVTAISTSRR